MRIFKLQLKKLGYGDKYLEINADSYEEALDKLSDCLEEDDEELPNREEEIKALDREFKRNAL